jgi:HlyD family secretion protein
MNTMFKSHTFYIAAATIIWGCGKSEDTIRPRVKPLVEAVYASGFVVAKDQYEITAQVEGYVTEKFVEDGDRIKKGEALYVIASDQQSARNRTAREAYLLATKNYREDSPVLNEAKAAMEAANTKKQFDSTNVVRYKNLYERNATTKVEFERIKLIYENANSDYLLQKSRYEKIKNQLYLDWQSAKNNLAIAMDESGRYTVRSEVDGMLFMSSKEKGEMVRRGEVIAVAGEEDGYYLELNIDELDVQRVKPGQEVLVKIDAYAGNIFKAEITKVYPLVDRKQQAVKADAILKEKLPSLFSGLALEANIIIHKKDAAVVIPKSAILPGDSVMVLDDKDEKIKIKVIRGIETLDEVEITEGLDSTTLIVHISER